MCDCGTSTTDIVRTISNGVVALAALAGAVAAFMGLDAWRKQISATAFAAAGSAILKATYRVRGQIAHVRYGLIEGGEFADALKQKSVAPPDVGADDFQFKANSAVYETRFNKLADALAEFESAAIEAEVLWGKEVTDVITPLYKIVARLRAAIKMHLLELSDSEFKMDKASREKIRATLYDLSQQDKPDDFAAEVNSVVVSIEAVIKRHLPYRASQ
jgi:hypothetical protein